MFDKIEYVDPAKSKCDECGCSFGVHLETCSKFVNPGYQWPKDDSCYHSLVRIDEPAPKGKPYRWKCTKCGQKLKIASGHIQPSATVKIGDDNGKAKR